MLNALLFKLKEHITTRTTVFEKNIRFEQNEFLDFFKDCTCSALNIKSTCSCLPSRQDLKLKQDFVNPHTFLGSLVLLDLITPLLTAMIFLLTALSFCGLEKIFVELQTCLHVPVPNVTVS